MGVIAEMAQNVAVMYAGKVMEYADVKTLYASPKNPYTIGLLQSIPVLGRETKEKRLKTISGVVPSLLNLPSGCLYNDRCPDVFNDCRRAERLPPCGTRNVSSRRQSLCKVFEICLKSCLKPKISLNTSPSRAAFFSRKSPRLKPLMASV
jgi:oligopeptide/dipeptide ABC transporter ATP-binding protein